MVMTVKFGASFRASNNWAQFVSLCWVNDLFHLTECSSLFHLLLANYSNSFHLFFCQVREHILFGDLIINSLVATVVLGMMGAMMTF